MNLFSIQDYFNKERMVFIMLKHFSDATFKSEVLDSNMPVLVDFYADWCGPCKMMGPIVEELAGEYDGRASIGKINVDENSATAADYGVMSIPTLIVFKDGKIVDKIVGATSKSSLEAILNPLV